MSFRKSFSQHVYLQIEMTLIKVTENIFPEFEINVIYKQFKNIVEIDMKFH